MLFYIFVILPGPFSAISLGLYTGIASDALRNCPIIGRRIETAAATKLIFRET